MKPLMIALAILVMATAEPVRAEEPNAVELVQHYDALMAPRTFDALMTMTAHRQDGSTRSYRFRVLKSEDDKVRTWFLEPASAKGQEMLRVGDNQWVYMPNLKRSLRIASRESFQGGDFSNADVLRVNYFADYTATLVPSGSAATWAVELKARTPEAAYDRILLWMTKADRQPVRAEYFAASGKLLRSAVFEDVKSFRGVRRPARVVMRNELATNRFSELNTLDIQVDVPVNAQQFVLDGLGR